MNTNWIDETLALPTENAVRIALRTQQIIAHESGVINTIDPLGGSYFIEKLTNEMEEEALAYIKKIDDMGGMIKAIELGYPQREIAEAAYHYQRQIEKKEKIVVGMNDFIVEEESQIELLKIPDEVNERQEARLKKVKRERDKKRVQKALLELEKACEGNKNVIPLLIEAAQAYATEGEMMSIMKGVFGEYKDPAIW